MFNVNLSEIRSFKNNARFAPCLNVAKSEITQLEIVSFSTSTKYKTPKIEKGKISASPLQASKTEWENVNKQYREKINPSNLTKTWTDTFTDVDDIYSIAPELIDPNIPLRSSLELTEAANSISKKALKTVRNAEVGLSGKVKFVRFKNDHVLDRWFAIKRPMSLFQKILKSDNNIKTALKYYENNLNMALKIGNHPNFMQVRGIVVKEKNGKVAKPYLILEYIDGIRLRDIKNLSLKDKLEILSQLKNALAHLFELGILPIDANQGNFLITKNNVLKLIDFDAWKYESDDKELARGLYDVACRVVIKLSSENNFNSPTLRNPDICINGDFEESVDNLIKLFSNREEEKGDCFLGVLV